MPLKIDLRPCGNKVANDFGCESSKNVAYCYWAVAVIFPKGSGIG